MPVIELIEVRCPNCNRLLLRMGGFGLVEIRCPKCKALVRYPKLVPEIFSSEKEESLS